jgi:predicted phage terminase large subunit-like protein
VTRRADIDRELVRRRGFFEFIKLAWPIVEPAPYSDNWHIEEVARHCQAVTERRIRELVVNVPPGTSKSLVVSVLWHPWSWIVDPTLRYIFASFDPTLALNHAEKAFNLLTSQWFCERWGNLLKPGGSHAMGEYDSAAGGFRFSTSVGGKGTGRHCHVRVADDPIKPLDVEGTTKAVSAVLETTNGWWKNTMASRRADPSNFASVMVMQRLHESDPSAECVRDGYEHLCLPMRFVPDRASRTTVGGDRRTTEGELLDKRRFPEAAVADIEKSMGGRDGPIASAQLQQAPAPPGGLIFKEETFKHFYSNEAPFNRAFTCLSVDCAFKDATANSNVAIEVWGATDAKFHCYDSVSEHLSFTGTLTAVEAVIARYPEVNAILIEEKANGAAIIELLRKRFSNVVALIPKTSKLARAHAANVYYQAGSVHHLEGADWLGRKETSLKHFPKGRRNDDVDTTTQAVLWLAEQSMADFSAAMREFRREQASGQVASDWSRHFLLT